MAQYPSSHAVPCHVQIPRTHQEEHGKNHIPLSLCCPPEMSEMHDGQFANSNCLVFC